MQKQSIVIAGGSGLVGQALLRHIDRSIYDVYILSRQAKESVDIHYVQWDTNAKTIDLDFVPDHIINLAGAGIADKLWSTARRKELIDSRVDSAKTIASFLSKHVAKPKTYISASAIGYYGDRQAELLSESSTIGQGFLSECCQVWESSATETGQLCDRTVILRIGIVISDLGGALPKMLMTKDVGIYNYFGDGSQFYSWIHMDDLCRMIMYTLECNEVDGIYNAVSPNPMTNRSFMRDYMDAVGSNGILVSIPKIALRLIMGEMSHVVLDSAKVIADKWLKIGFVFNYPDSAFKK
jgi:uncharacterized protein